MRFFASILAAALTLAPAAAGAVLPEGAVAPDFNTQGALAGQPFNLNLRALLRQGPVVL